VKTALRARLAGRVARLAIAGISALAVLGLGAEEQSLRRVPRIVVAPARGEPSPVPFGVSGDEFGYEQIYSGALFPEAVEIREVAFATAAGFGNPHSRLEEPADRLLEQRRRERGLPGPAGAPDRTPTGRHRLPDVGGLIRSCTHLRIALATTGQDPAAVNAASARTKSTNYRVIVDETRFDFRARGDGSFDLAFPVRLDPPFQFRPERDGNLLIEINIGSEAGALPIYVEAGKSPLVGSVYRLPGAPVALTYPGRGLYTRFLVDELILKKKTEPGLPVPAKKASPEEPPPGAGDQPTN
jgi:hypothetical protein